MADDTIKQKHKRVVKRIGDIFCVEFGNGFKGYFQYIAKDIEMLSSAVIRAFYTHYPIDYEPVIEEIIADKIAFYGHTFLDFGVKLGGWYKVGTSKELCLDKLEKIYFGTVASDLPIFEDGRCVTKIVPPLDNWHVWRLGQDRYWHVKLPEDYYDQVEEGSAVSYTDIEDRMKCGYYKFTSPIYQAIKRHPRPDVDSFLRRENEGMTSYYHFYGEYAVEQIDIVGEAAVRLTKAQPKCDGHFLYDKPFGNINWRYREFITAEEFYAVWNSLNPAEVCRQHGNKKPESL